jgi:hypothetical protein
MIRLVVFSYLLRLASSEQPPAGWRKNRGKANIATQAIDETTKAA